MGAVLARFGRMTAGALAVIETAEQAIAVDIPVALLVRVMAVGTHHRSVDEAAAEEMVLLVSESVDAAVDQVGRLHQHGKLHGQVSLFGRFRWQQTRIQEGLVCVAT